MRGRPVLCEAKPAKRAIQRILTDWLAGRPIRQEREVASACCFLPVGENLDCKRRQRLPMFAAHRHACRGDRPNGALQVEFLPRASRSSPGLG